MVLTTRLNPQHRSGYHGRAFVREKSPRIAAMAGLDAHAGSWRRDWLSSDLVEQQPALPAHRPDHPAGADPLAGLLLPFVDGARWRPDTPSEGEEDDRARGVPPTKSSNRLHRLPRLASTASCTMRAVVPSSRGQSLARAELERTGVKPIPSRLLRSKTSPQTGRGGSSRFIRPGRES